MSCLTASLLDNCPGSYILSLLSINQGLSCPLQGVNREEVVGSCIAVCFRYLVG